MNCEMFDSALRQRVPSNTTFSWTVAAYLNKTVEETTDALITSIQIVCPKATSQCSKNAHWWRPELRGSIRQFRMMEIKAKRFRHPINWESARDAQMAY